jgi:hypothetical protein
MSGEEQLAAAKARIVELETVHENPMLPNASMFDGQVGDYEDFVDRVCWVITVRAGERPISLELREAMRLFWSVSPHYIAVAMTVMRRRMLQAEADRDRAIGAVINGTLGRPS